LLSEIFFSQNKSNILLLIFIFFCFYILLRIYGLNNEGNRGTSIFVKEGQILKFKISID